MKVRRIVAHIATLDTAKARAFYQQVLGLDLLMDHGWIKTFGPDALMMAQAREPFGRLLNFLEHR